MAYTALTIITDALLDIGVLADEEVPSASMADGALRKLNNMIDSWNTKSLMVYGSKQYTIPLVANQGVYTIGPTGNLNVPRPSQITSAYVRDTTLPAAQRADYPLYLYNNQEWADVTFKSQAAVWPNWGIWFDDGFPLISAYVNPVPTSSQYTVIFWASGLIGNLLLDDVISLAPGYKRCLTANLAIEVSGSYGVQVPASVVKIAEESMSDIKTMNLQVDQLQIDPLLADGLYYDINIGRYR